MPKTPLSSTPVRTSVSPQFSVWMRYSVWHAQANSKGIVLTSRGRSRPMIPVPGVKDGQVKERMESLTGQFQFKRLPGKPEPHKIVGEIGPEPQYRVRAEIAEMVWNDQVLMDLVFSEGAYEAALRQAKCERELEILELVRKLTTYLEVRSQS